MEESNRSDIDIDIDIDIDLDIQIMCAHRCCCRKCLYLEESIASQPWYCRCTHLQLL